MMEIGRRDFIKLGASILAGGIVMPEHLLSSPIDEVFKIETNKELIDTIYKKFSELQDIVGFTNFSILGLEDGFKIYKSHKNKDLLDRDEYDYLVYLFYLDASKYGFYGDKQADTLWDKVETKKIVKVESQYLFEGKAALKYKKISDENKDAILTSGIRSIVKQIHLFYGKIKEENYIIPKAAHSIAPVGYSHHFTKDFDIGQNGWGYANFSEKFVESEVFQTLAEKGFIDLRYPRGNGDGVRFEPWHIKV